MTPLGDAELRSDFQEQGARLRVNSEYMPGAGYLDGYPKTY
jgi:hypothetical protein